MVHADEPDSILKVEALLPWPPLKFGNTRLMTPSLM